MAESIFYCISESPKQYIKVVMKKINSLITIHQCSFLLNWLPLFLISYQLIKHFFFRNHYTVYIYDLSVGREVPSGRRRRASSGGSGNMLPWKFFYMNMRCHEIWYILRHNFEKCSSVCTDLVASGWFFRYSFLYTVMITTLLGGWGKLGTLRLGRFLVKRSSAAMSEERRLPFAGYINDNTQIRKK